MDGLVTSGPLRFFLELTDPRAANVRYRLIDLIVITICAIICDCDSWDDVQDFARAKRKWFSSFLELDYGIPSHDTFERVFGRLDPVEFERCFVNWMSSVVELTRPAFFTAATWRFDLVGGRCCIVVGCSGRSI